MDPMIEETRRRLLAAILDADRARAAALLADWGEERGTETVAAEILEPTLESIGSLWDGGAQNISLAQAYVAGKVAEDFLIAAAGRTWESRPVAGVAVIGNIEDDFHSLGRRMVGIFLASAGWKVYDLGNDVLADAFVETALEVGASVVGASAMMYATAMNIASIRDEIDRRNLGSAIKIAAGGAVFKLRPELLAEVGADGSSGNAIQAPALFSRLASLVPRRIPS
jgi:methanogenic corrinoid protein MtbC1